jgi:hypothetical protein
MIYYGGIMTEHEQKLNLPRNPASKSVTSLLFNVPDEVRNRLPMTPDHVREARTECTYTFLEESLLPRMQSNRDLSAEELLTLATDFKANFQKQHPNDSISGHNLIADSELNLINLHIYYQTSEDKEDIANLVSTTLKKVSALIDQNSEDLLKT